MTEAAPLPPAPQTSNIFVDRPCLKCGYNLRGQTATWNRRALNWQVTCPECGGAQVVMLGTAERGGGQSIVTLLLAILGVWLAWQLGSQLSHALNAMTGPPAYALMRRLATPTTATAARDIFDYDWLTLLGYFTLQSVPIVLAALSLGVMISIAPYGRPQDRNFIVLLLVLGATVYGVHLNFTSPAPPDGEAHVPATMTWILMATIIGALLALLAARIGLAAGRPFAKMVAGMYVKKEP